LSELGGEREKGKTSALVCEKFTPHTKKEGKQPEQRFLVGGGHSGKKRHRLGPPRFRKKKKRGDTLRNCLDEVMGVLARRKKKTGGCPSARGGKRGKKKERAY